MSSAFFASCGSSSAFIHNPGLLVQTGESYRFTVVGEPVDWRDASIPATPDGQLTDRIPRFLRTSGARWFRRFDGAEWYALVGCVKGDGNWMFKIGRSTEQVMARGGRLTAFANDAWLMYWNNHGTLNLEVERLG